MSTTNLFKEYAELEDILIRLTQQKEDLREKITDYMRRNGVSKSQTEHGSFTLTERNNWVYSKKVDDLLAKAKLRQIYEQEKGIAEKTSATYLRFTRPKE